MAALAGALGVILATVSPVAAHGEEVPPAPEPLAFALAWSLDPTIWLPVLATALAWTWAVHRVNAGHPANPIPIGRTWALLGGLAAILIALQSGIERYDTTLFSIHMVQHLLLVFVAAPLLVLAAPITLVLRVASPAVRARVVLPALHSRAVRVVGHPLVAWLVFTAVMWGSHFSPLFDAALESVPVHDLEHVLYLGTALLFWWPIVGRDPSPYRMGYPARLLYLVLQMPLNSFLGVAILFAAGPIYPHYVTTGRTWGPTALADQQAAGALMWGLGDLGFLVALLLVIAAWMRAEDADTARREGLEDALAAAERARLAGDVAATGQAAGSGPAQADPGIGAAR